MYNALFFALWAGLFGLIIGSFLNVVIYRLPIIMQRDYENAIAHEKGQALPHTDRYNLVVPRSTCPHCGHRLRIQENIPLLSYLKQRGRCTQCKARISARYPVIESLTGALSALLIWQMGPTMTGLASCVFVYFLIAMTFIDAETQLLPDNLTLPLLWCGLLVNIPGTFVPLSNAVIGAVAGYLSLWLVFWAFKWSTGKEGLGYGDFKLLAAMGAWLGWMMLPLMIVAASVAGAMVGVIMVLLRKHDRDQPMPFGPYLAAAGLVALLYGDPLINAYLGWKGG